ncbi:MAG: phosphoribosylamine--glycine ligase [Dehalococcoidia bacterium]|nr:phosphoribosylamine--glycine ligase [Dehalococcoidia bacterium]
MGARVLLAGSGGREHATAWKLLQSSHVERVFVAPGNGGTSLIATNLPHKSTDIDGIVAAAVANKIDFYLSSSDDPQPLGLVDRLQAEGILCYGPSAAAARIEASKAWAKAFMARHHIPTAAGESFSTLSAAQAHIESLPEGKLWVKASGLAAGKGAVGCETREEALEAARDMLIDHQFGTASETIVIERDMEGWETSAHAFCDGNTAVLWPFSTDYKRALDGGQGLNTGGMGAYSPSAGVSAELGESIQRIVVDPVLKGMAAEGHPYNGTLYPGIMMTGEGPKILEYNARSGDPETQVLLPRLESDLFEVATAAARGELHTVDIRWSPRPAVGVVIASRGYPESFETGFPIHGLDAVDDGVLVFHMGTRAQDGGFVTSGGRVCTVVATGETMTEARERAYDNARRITFENAYYRTDIALEAV